MKVATCSWASRIKNYFRTTTFMNQTFPYSMKIENFIWFEYSPVYFCTFFFILNSEIKLTSTYLILFILFFQLKEKSKPELRDYNSVANLKADQLKSLCSKFNIELKLPKKAKIILLCHVLGISTVGQVQNVSARNGVTKYLAESQREELENITPSFLGQLVDWTSNISSLPDIEDSVIKKYLINTDVLQPSDARTYKITRPFALRQFVHSVFYCDTFSESFSVVRALCNPSQSTNLDEVKLVFVIVEKYLGEPFGGFCTCTVGNTERCGHIGAVLFRLAELQATGLTEGPSCTDILCKWAEPKTCKAEPTVFQDLKIRKKTTPIRRTVEDYGQRVTKSEPPSYDEVVALRASLIEATHHTGQYCPAVHILNCDRFKPPGAIQTASPIVAELPDFVTFDNAVIAPAKEVETITTPPVVKQLVTRQFSSEKDSGFIAACNELYKKAENMDLDINQVDSITKGQACNPEWHEQRRAVITATKFSAVIKVIEKKRKCDSLLTEICSEKVDRLRNVPAIKWGRKNENKVKEAYIKKVKTHHKDFEMSEHGLMVYKDCHFVRGSPDGIVSCSCHGRTLLEVKCPYSARMMTVTEGVLEGRIKYLEKVNGRFQLKDNTPDGYYAQIQGLMGITNIRKCHLVVWTTRDMATVVVEFDENFFKHRLVKSCKEFFRSHIVPKLLLNEQECTNSDDKTVSLSNDWTHESEILIATPIAMGSSPEKQPQKRKRLEASKKKQTVPTSPPLVIPTVSVHQKTSAELILAEVVPYKCAACKKVLPEDNIASDNSNASVGCDCTNCGGCNIWMCWPCAQYDQEWADCGYNWYCPPCTRNCDIVY